MSRGRGRRYNHYNGGGSNSSGVSRYGQEQTKVFRPVNQNSERGSGGRSRGGHNTKSNNWGERNQNAD